MPIEVITGLPGHGKTLLMMTKLREAAEKAERPLFAAGIEGLKPGLATVIVDPLKWNAIDETREGTCTCGHTWGVHDDGSKYKIPGRPPHAHIIPDGSLIFVDESWKWFGHLHNASGQKTPDHVLDFAEHRHRGLDFVMTTQGPGQLYPFLRTLIEGHTHVVRAMGLKAANLYTWAELNDDVKSRTMREAALRKLWTYPKQEFDTYKSATQHTIKSKVPLRVFLMPVALLGAICAAFIAYTYLKPSARAQTTTEGAGADLSASPQAGKPAHVSAVDALKPEAVAEYFANFTPRHPAIPASAPAYDKRRVAAEPQVYCMSSSAGETAEGYKAASACGCLTEQGTPYALPQAECTLIARKGHAYDPYKQPERKQSRGGGDRQRDHDAPTDDAVPVSVIEAEQVSGYGDLGERKITAAP